MLSYALITFTVGRFFATALATVLAPSFILMVYSIIAIAMNAYIAAGHGSAAVGVLIAIFFFEAPMYPTIFTLGTENLGRHTRRGAGILVMGVSGGAVFPPIQGAIADAASTKVSYIVPLVGFCVVLAYAAFHWVSHGFQIRNGVKQVVADISSASDVVSEKDHAIVQIEERR
jgi:FHS family L-fucose permease-like MFS transporter